MRSWNLPHTSFIRLPHHRDNLKSSTIQNPCQLIFNLSIDALFLGNKMIPDIINHHFTRYWESDDLWVSYPWSTGCTSGDPTVYFVLVSLFKIIYIFSRVWSVGTYPINDPKILESNSQGILPKLKKQPIGIQPSYRFSKKFEYDHFLSTLSTY